MERASTFAPPIVAIPGDSPGAVIARELAEIISQTDPHKGRFSFVYALSNIIRIIDKTLYAPSPLPNHVNVDLIDTIRRTEFVFIITGLQMFDKSSLAQLDIRNVRAKRARRIPVEIAKANNRRILRKKLWDPDLSGIDRHSLFEELAARLFDDQAIEDLGRDETGVALAIVIADTDKPGIVPGLCSFFTMRLNVELPDTMKPAGRA